VLRNLGTLVMRTAVVPDTNSLASRSPEACAHQPIGVCTKLITHTVEVCAVSAVSLARRLERITFSALGQQAPLDEKKKWDPDFAKRRQMKAFADSSSQRIEI
jgi:hypothetical protein